MKDHYIINYIRTNFEIYHTKISYKCRTKDMRTLAKFGFSVQRRLQIIRTQSVVF